MKILPSEYAEMYSREGFHKFLGKFWQASRNLAIKIGESEYVKPMVAHTLYYMKNLMTVRLEKLFEEIDFQNKKNIDEIISKHESQISKSSIQNSKRVI